ncbi:hypothetical protein E2562_025559 [Oryza meyeriana var. granulata]|uniref:RING-type domain-containing protein n=1 Tax=Oryza meyeriana var. granulata TaxID=110450 RepID=A0A6G1FCG0_9ORYZ|nr:hypothetical protein E2562_025559 [Oryza meyeriana var. granulata]
MSVTPADSCYRWSCDFAAAHAVFACGFITAPVAVFHLVRTPRSAHAIFFAMVSALFTAVSLILCCHFYADLKRPPWPRSRLAAAATRAQGSPHDLRRHPEQPVMVERGSELQAALAAGRIPSYEHRDDDGEAECAVCLGEVEHGEAVRRLPACLHVFHAACIDRWLRASATCPVCRCTTLPPPNRPPEVVVIVNS